MGYNSRKLRTEFLDKGWTKSSINRLLKKFRDTAQWTGQRQTAKCPHGWKHGPSERYGSESTEPDHTHSTVREISRGQAFLSHLLSASKNKNLQLKCFKRRGDMRKSWLRQTAPLTFSRRKQLAFKKRVAVAVMFIIFLFLQQWKNCEKRLRFHRVKAKITKTF